MTHLDSDSYVTPLVHSRTTRIFRDTHLVAFSRVLRENARWRDEKPREKEREGKEKRSLIYSKLQFASVGVELSRLSGYVAASVELRKCLIHMLQLRSNRVAIIGYGVPVSRFPSEERRDFSIGGIVFNLSCRRGAHPRVPRKVFHRKFLRRSIPISSLFLASFHLISSYRWNNFADSCVKST